MYGRARFERSRTRTKERALLELQALVDAFDAPRLPAARRLRYAFGCEFPYRLALRRELGEQLLAMGLVGAAIATWREGQCCELNVLQSCSLRSSRHGPWS